MYRKQRAANRQEKEIVCEAKREIKNRGKKVGRVGRDMLLLA